jgi:hypothetical protein
MYFVKSGYFNLAETEQIMEVEIWLTAQNT